MNSIPTSTENSYQRMWKKKKKALAHKGLVCPAGVLTISSPAESPSGVVKEGACPVVISWLLSKVLLSSDWGGDSLNTTGHDLLISKRCFCIYDKLNKCVGGELGLERSSSTCVIKVHDLVSTYNRETNQSSRASTRAPSHTEENRDPDAISFMVNTGKLHLQSRNSGAGEYMGWDLLKLALPVKRY
ncbi:hypothetical protein RRG08_056869 [Elysia crispata]|uniref:Uncharacterized protein n=1 Tax=Elysia crispata TaxID=231223 RepID=A0AAE1DDQ4_9GAST|nr:hypothetical protein RRG08_056869 [Elysia crispata]